jgi:hypothetical protein
VTALASLDARELALVLVALADRFTARGDHRTGEPLLALAFALARPT